MQEVELVTGVLGFVIVGIIHHLLIQVAVPALQQVRPDLMAAVVAELARDHQEVQLHTHTQHHIQA